MPDKGNFGAVLQPTVYRWQNDRDGLQQDDAVAALRASQGASGFHEMNHPVIAQPVPFTKAKRAQSTTDDETWVDGQVNPTLSLFDQGDTRATTVAVACINMQGSKSNACVSQDGSAYSLNAMHGHDVHAVAFANRTRDGIKVPEVMADGVTPALTNPGNGGRSDAINVAVAHAFYSTGGTHGMNQHPEVSPAIKVGSGLGIPSPPAVAVAFQQNQLGEVRCNTVAGTVNTNSNPSGRNTPMVAIGTDCYNGAITGDVAATMGTPGSSVNASGPTVMQAVAFKTGNSAKARSNAESAEVTPTLGSDTGGNTIPAVAFTETSATIKGGSGARGYPDPSDGNGHSIVGVPSSPAVAVAPSLTATNDPSRSPQSSEVTQQVAAVHASTMTVRRLTPRECERLQGFPDDWTMIPYRGKSPEDCPDGPRYKAIGNSMACNVMAWIGERIAAYENAHTRSTQ